MRSLVVTIALACSFGGAAFAQDDATRARAAFQRGVAAYKEGKFDEALAAFNEANRIKPNPVVLYNIGQAEAELGKSASAVNHFEQYLAGAKNIPGERRVEVKKEITRLSAKVAKLVVESPVAGAKVVVDGNVVGTTPLDKTLIIDPGAHRVVVSRAGYDDFALDITAPLGETYRLSAKLVKPKTAVAAVDTEEPRRAGGGPPAVPPPSPPVAVREPTPAPPVIPPAATPPPAVVPPQPTTPPPVVAPPPAQTEMQPNVALGPQIDTERQHEGKLSKVWFWTGVGTTAVLAGTTIIVGSVALSRSNEYNDPTTPAARKAELLQSGPGMAHATDALLATTIVAAGVTTWLYFKTDWGVVPAPNGVAVAGHF